MPRSVITSSTRTIRSIAAGCAVGCAVGCAAGYGDRSAGMFPRGGAALTPCILGLLAWAVILPASPAAAQAPPVSREELMHQWDLDRNGTVDETEAEIAKSRMRRARTEAARNSGIDPLTGRPRENIDPLTGQPRTKIDPLTGRPEQPKPGRGDDDDLILVPGTGERPARRSRSAADEEEESKERKPSADRPALPGTRVPQNNPLVPSVRPKDLVPSLPGVAGRGAALPGGTPPAPSSGQPWEQLRGQPRSPAGSGTADRTAGRGPGVISGGLRGGAAPARPGYGAAGAGTDLNAGRLSAGPPQGSGRGPGGATAAGPTIATPQPAGRVPLVGGSRPLPSRGSATGMPPAIKPPAIMPPAMRSGMQPALPAVPRTTLPRTTLPPATRPAVPRVPSGSADDFFGR
jgi:hypothetical protein